MYNMLPQFAIPVSVKEDTSPEMQAGGEGSFQSTKSGGGLKFWLLDCMVKARAKGSFFHRHRYAR